MEPSSPSLTATLQQVRRARRVSQLELSLRVGVSQRHVSFVESGRARPSRELLLAWLQELDAPLVVRNQALLHAGYAPAYGAMPLSDPALAVSHEALDHLLAAHDPMPALVLDVDWNLLRLNRGGQWLAATLLPGTAAAPAGTTVNMLDLLAHPEGLLSRTTNLPVVGPPLLAHLRDHAAVHPALTPRVDAVAGRLRTLLGATLPVSDGPRPLPPLLTTRFATPFGELAFFSMFTTFGTPQDITLASLRVEHMFAADEGTRTVLTAQVPDAAGASAP